MSSTFNNNNANLHTNTNTNTNINININANINTDKKHKDVYRYYSDEDGTHAILRHPGDSDSQKESGYDLNSDDESEVPIRKTKDVTISTPKITPPKITISPV